MGQTWWLKGEKRKKKKQKGRREEEESKNDQKQQGKSAKHNEGKEENHSVLQLNFRVAKTESFGREKGGVRKKRE